ncbi:MAG: HEAT repeat domain-containing protein [Synechococcales cyanobacterium RM1_1_8]|nr:HEAT repeat domain-containing protein [Synechococcales cyanobacterium RM1_1_8]
MAKTLTIELPDNLSEPLGALADNALTAFVLQTLQLLATATQALQDANPVERAKAATLLGLVGSETALPSLARALDDEAFAVREAATLALQNIGTKPAIALLEQTEAAPSPLTADPLTADPLAALIGTLHLGTTDLAENHDRHIREALEQELQVSE